jgi:putative tryptophan/tyrosine transport system substrate-binding protein
MMRRRNFITFLAGTAVLPATARAQQPELMRRVGVLMTSDESDPLAKVWLSGFIQGLQESGWSDGQNVQMYVFWAAGNVDRMRTFAKELVRLRADVILAHNSPATAALQRETQSVPIVFVIVPDPVGQGFVASLARPGGNITGFVFIEATMEGKWLELLTEIAPGVRRVAAMFNPDTAPSRGSYVLPSFEEAARSLKVEAIAAPVHSDAEIETVVTSLGREGGGGLIVMLDPFMVVHRPRIISLTARNNVPAVYNGPYFVREGGLLSYGPNEADIFRRAAPYVDRILRGAKPVDLPVQQPIRFEMTLNLKTAKALGLDVSLSFQQRADEVLE